MSRYYHICSRNVGRPACITTVDGREYRGVINRVTNRHVFIQPMGRGIEGEEGLSELNQKAAIALGQGKNAQAQEILWGFGFFPGLGIGITLGAIGTLAFLPFFW